MNKQITENYVSYEIAKLLKEKGFVAQEIHYIYYYYEEDDGYCFEKLLNGDKFDSKKMIAVPTLQMAMKWLREVHKMYIYIKPLEDGNCFSVHLLYNGIDKLIEGGAWGSYESAVEAALLYVLKNLI